MEAPETGKNTVSKITETVHKMNEARAEWNRQALVNVLFLYGKQHFTLNRLDKSPSVGQSIVWELENIQSKSAIKRTCNYILPLFRSLLSRQIRQKANIFAEPMTSMQQDIEAARISKEVLTDFWNRCNGNNQWMRQDFTGMMSLLIRLTLYNMSVGVGYLVPYFNPKAKSYVYDQETKNIFQAEVGEAEARVCSPLNMFMDRFGRYSIERRFISVEQVWDEFGVEVAPSKVNEEDTEVKIRRLIEGTDIEKTDCEGVYVYTKRCVSSKEYPEGLEISCTDKEMLTEDDRPLPKHNRGRMNVFEFRYQDLGFGSRGQGCIEQVIDAQQDLNFTVSRIAQHKKLMTGKIYVPRGADLNVKFDDNVGQIINYALGRKPTPEPAPGVPSYFYQEIQRIREVMESLMNSHDVSMGRTPGQVNSGVGIANLTEIDNAQIAPELIMFEQKLGFFGEAVLDICQENYTERRLLAITGENMGMEVRSFIGSDLFGQKNIQIKMGSNFPLGQRERTEYILMLKNQGFISPERAKELLEFNDIDGAFSSLDTQGAKQDILNIIDGNVEVIAAPYEDATVRLKVINDFRKGNVYQKLDTMKRQLIDNLAAQYQDMLLREQQAAAGMGAPLPPAPTK